jgi:hypothetical protein
MTLSSRAITPEDASGGREGLDARADTDLSGGCPTIAEPRGAAWASTSYLTARYRERVYAAPQAALAWLRPSWR